MQAGPPKYIQKSTSSHRLRYYRPAGDGLRFSPGSPQQPSRGSLLPRLGPYNSFSTLTFYNIGHIMLARDTIPAAAPLSLTVELSIPPMAYKAFHGVALCSLPDVFLIYSNHSGLPEKGHAESCLRAFAFYQGTLSTYFISLPKFL